MIFHDCPGSEWLVIDDYSNLGKLTRFEAR